MGRLSRRNFLQRGTTAFLAGLLLRKLGPNVLTSPHAAQASSSDHHASLLPKTHDTTPKRIYLAPDDHTDYLWTADEATYRQAFLEMLDYYLDQADATEGNPADFQSRWNCDGSFWIWTYEKNRTAAQFQRLIDRIRDGHISFPLNAVVVCLGGAPAEAVIRGMYYAGRLERRHNLRVQLAIAMENQTHPYGLGALWAGAGAKYSWKGICDCDTQVPRAGDRQYEIYWMVGPDGSRILMKWNSVFPGNGAMGGYAEARDPLGIVDFVDTNSAFIARYPYKVIGAFGKGSDDLKTLTPEFVAAAKAKSNATRRVIVSNSVDFFQDFEVTYGADLPGLACSFGNEWDLYCASLAEVSAQVKRSVEKCRGAEALATLVTMQNPRFMDGRETARDHASIALGLFWEHDLGMAGRSGAIVGQRIAWLRRLAGQVQQYVDDLQNAATAALGSMIRRTGPHVRVFAFNPLSWARTDVTDIAFPGQVPVHVIDTSTGQETPVQLVTRNGRPYLRILARDVPPVGYKVFEVRPGAGHRFGEAASVSGDGTRKVMESDSYRLTLTPRGAITSLIDKTRGHQEFARQIGGRWINDLGPGSGALEIEDAGPVSVTLKATGPSPLTHTTRLTLVRESRRIEIRNEITQNFVDTHTWAFGFNLDAPDVWHEEVGALVRARLLTDGGHYSPRNARYDWLTLNHFVDISGRGLGATLSNADCYFMRLGESTVSRLDANTPQVSVLAGGRVVNKNNGLPSQGGDTYFLQRFALQTHDGYHSVAAMRFALEHQNPLVTGVVTGGSAYPPSSYSFLGISNPNVCLWALKPAEDGIGKGIIARVWNLSASPARFSLSLAPGPIQTARRMTHIETPIGNATVNDGVLAESLAPCQLKTFALKLSSGVHTGFLR